MRWGLKVRSREKLQGVIVPTITPFDERGRLDDAALRRHVERLIRAGVDGLYPGGTTSEGPLLSRDERERVAAVVIEAAGGRVPVIVQSGAISTDETIHLSRHAEQLGASAVAVLAPWYYRLSPEALGRHFRRVAETVPDLPVLLYDIPGNTGNPLPIGIVARLFAEVPNIVGMKDSTGRLTHLREALALGPGFLVFCGSDRLLLPALTAGVTGIVPGNANVVPEVFVAAWAAHRRGDVKALRAANARAQTARRALGDGNLGLFKAVLGRMGSPMGGVRSPLLDPEPSEIDAAMAALAEEVHSSMDLLRWSRVRPAGRKHPEQ
jgi:4-hydroxy-tetrahydrodipicolinate synthase